MRAIISVFDKTGIVEFAKGLASIGVEIISSGGTYNLLKKEGLSVMAVEEVTQFAECLDGRVKTLHPRIHGGILANRKVPEHMETIAGLGIEPIDLVVVNLYPFENVISKEHTLAEAIENIDIGGPSLIRAAAKNYQSVSVVTDMADYPVILEKIKNQELKEEDRFALAKKAFTHTASYDSIIANYLNRISKEEFPEVINLTLKKKQDLRYGENPHQKAAYYANDTIKTNGIENVVVLHGKQLSYNNINDTQGAINLALEFTEPVCVAVKHATPCGVAVGETILEAYEKAYESDPVSIFGGILCVNREVDAETAKRMNEVFFEVIVAPSYTGEALEILKQKQNLRLLTLESLCQPKVEGYLEFKGVAGGVLVQDTDTQLYDELKTVTDKAPTDAELADLRFAMKVVKHVKSNAIVVAKKGQTLGIGGGEVSRIWAAEAALDRAGDKVQQAVLASDAFFPFADVVALCGEKGISAIMQPGGSVNDALSIEECNKQGIAMVFTAIRHFKH